MGLYTEVMCDVLTEGSDPDRPLAFICWTHAANGPQGHDAVSARKEARTQGWKRTNGRDICPGCQKHGDPA